MNNWQDVKSLWGDVAGGAVGALIAVPIILSCGVVSYHSLGPAFVTAGISAAFVAAVVAAMVSGLFGGAPLHVSSPKTTHSAILSGLIATVATHHSFTDIYSGDSAPAALMTICFLTLLVSGVTQLFLGASRIGGLVKYVPHPVLAGFINGFAIQIMWTQAPKLLGLDHESQLVEALTGTAHVNSWALGFAVLSAGLVVLAGKASKLVPAALVGLVGGTTAQMLAAQYLPAEELGPVIGALPTGIPFVLRADEMLQFVSTTAFSRHAFDIVATGVTLALVSSIQSLLSISASSARLFGCRHDSNRELMAQGAANMLSALFGGAPSGGSPNVTQAVAASGGRTRLANISYALTFLGLSFGLSQVIALIPLSVMAGVVIVTTAGAMDKWTQQLLVGVGNRKNASFRRDIALNLSVVVVVALLVVTVGALAALGVGMATVFLVFLHRANARMVRRVRRATHVRSRCERPFAAFDTLVRHGQRIVIIELDGPIFFGSAETVARSVENESATADWVILDLSRVGHFDSSGVMVLKRVDDMLVKADKRLLLAGLPAGGSRRRFLRAFGLARPDAEGRIYDTTEAALARAENELLDTLERSRNKVEQVGWSRPPMLAALSPQASS